MKTVAVFVCISISLFVAIFIPFILSAEQSKAALAKARARRIAEAKMNARLLRLNL